MDDLARCAALKSLLPSIRIDLLARPPNRTGLAEALGGADSAAFLRTVERLSAIIEALREELADVQSRRAPVALDADLARAWPDMNVEQRRRVLHSVFDSVFVWRTPAQGRNGKFPIAGRTRLFLAGEVRRSRDGGSAERSAPSHLTVQLPP